jgi:hypothetical protein
MNSIHSEEFLSLWSATPTYDVVIATPTTSSSKRLSPSQVITKPLRTRYCRIFGYHSNEWYHPLVLRPAGCGSMPVLTPGSSLAQTAAKIPKISVLPPIDPFSSNHLFLCGVALCQQDFAFSPLLASSSVSCLSLC